MSEVIITPDYDGLYDDWFDPPMEIKMSCKNNEDIVINTKEGCCISWWLAFST